MRKRSLFAAYRYYHDSYLAGLQIGQPEQA